MSQYSSTICYLNSYTPNLIILVLIPTLTFKVFMTLYTVWSSEHWKNVYSLITLPYKKWLKEMRPQSHELTKKNDWVKYLENQVHHQTPCYRPWTHQRWLNCSCLSKKKNCCNYYSLLFTNYDFISLLQ